jgi:probable F420-dependent oxidoreductase
VKIGVTFPLAEIGDDPGGVRAYAEAIEDLGFETLHCGDHIVGTDRRVHPEFTVGYSNLDPSLDPLVLFGFFAAVTSRVELTTGVLLLGQRETALVAKQAATVDVLTGGRLRLGVGVGGFAPEFEAVGADPRDRGRRCEEQIAVLRALWMEESVEFDGRWHRIHGFGCNPRPVRRPIPIWLGGSADAVLDRVGRLADGWLLARQKPSAEIADGFAKVRLAAERAGRDPSAIGLEGRVHLLDGGTIEQCVAETLAWAQLGATHVVLMTLFAGLHGPDAHVRAAAQYRRSLPDSVALGRHGR